MAKDQTNGFSHARQMFWTMFNFSVSVQKYKLDELKKTDSFMFWEIFSAAGSEFIWFKVSNK